MDIVNEPPPVPADDHARLLRLMEDSDREAARGLTVPLTDVLAELDSIADAIEARQRASAE